MILLKPDRGFGYCLPASSLEAQYWTGEQYVFIPIEDVKQFRFVIDDSDWFGDLHERIVSRFAHSKRPEHNIPDGAIAENYAAAMDLEPEIVDVPTKEELESRLAGYPWWKIERWNRRAAHTGYGVYLPISREAKIANVVWMGYRWSRQDKLRYFATLQLPVRFHQDDVPPNLPILLIRAISVRTRKAHWVTDFPTRVTGWRLDPGPFNCLYYVDCGNYRMNGVERSGLLFPSEYINHKELNGKYSRHLDKTVTSGRDFVRKYGDYKKSREYDAYLTNLERCLLAPWAGFHVREGKDFDDAIVDFANAHVDEEKPLTWYGCGNLTAKEDYLVRARDFWQKLADEWVTDGIIKNPARGMNAPLDGDDDDPDWWREFDDREDEDVFDVGDGEVEDEAVVDEEFEYEEDSE